jgi:hypothetical protein
VKIHDKIFVKKKLSKTKINSTVTTVEDVHRVYKKKKHIQFNSTLCVVVNSQQTILFIINQADTADHHHPPHPSDTTIFGLEEEEQQQQQTTR